MCVTTFIDTFLKRNDKKIILSLIYCDREKNNEPRKIYTYKQDFSQVIPFCLVCGNKDFKIENDSSGHFFKGRYKL